LAGEADVCSVFFTRLHQRNRQLQSRIKAYEDAISLQVQIIFVSGVCGHSVPVFLMSGFHRMNVRYARVLESTRHLWLCICACAHKYHRPHAGGHATCARAPRMHTWQACRPLISEPEVMFVETVMKVRTISCARTKTLVAQEDAGKRANAEIHLKTSEIQNLQGDLAALKVFVFVYTSTLIYITHEYLHEQVRAGRNMHVRTSLPLFCCSLFKLEKP
jgi:hypothetical protein